MFARLTTIQGDPGKVEEMVKEITSTVVPTAQKLAGFKGGTWLADRATGKGIGITFWASEEELRASEEAADRLRKTSTQKLGATIVSIERFEVVAQA